MKNRLNQLKEIIYRKGILPFKGGHLYTPDDESSPLLKSLKTLENRLLGALHFLRKTSIKNQGESVRLSQLPWFFLVGTSGSGKTTLLANSNINFILDKKFKQENILSLPRSEACDWWVTRDLVLVDIPGSYIALKEKNISLPNKLWQHFLHLVHKYRGAQGLKGVIFTLSLPELMDKKNRAQLIACLKPRFLELKKEFGESLPFYLVLTKCDLIPGFSDFFSDCGLDELAQAWGITVPSPTDGESLADLFSARFDALIARLNKQLIWRLHQERNPYAKLFIKDFPLQVERVKEALLFLLKDFKKEKTHFCLKGVYLTSAIQSAESQPTSLYPQIVSGDEFQQALQIMHNPVTPRHAYFVKQLILQGLLPPAKLGGETLKQNSKLYALTASCFIIAGTLGLFFLHGSQEKSSQPILAQNQQAVKSDMRQIMTYNQVSPLLDQRAINFSPVEFSN